MAIVRCKLCLCIALLQCYIALHFCSANLLTTLTALLQEERRQLQAAAAERRCRQDQVGTYQFPTWVVLWSPCSVPQSRILSLAELNQMLTAMRCRTAGWRIRRGRGGGLSRRGGRRSRRTGRGATRPACAGRSPELPARGFPHNRACQTCTFCHITHYINRFI